MAGPPDNAPLQTRIVDDKSPLCIPFILSRLQAFRTAHPSSSNTLTRPFIIGLNGVQGVGKTTLVRALQQTLQEREGLNTLVVSIDDFYLTHADQLALAAAHPDNALVQYRGEPGTHDIPLLKQFLSSLLTHAPTTLPTYDKAAHSGLGDRDDPETFRPLNGDPNTPPIQVLLLEGWCVGFRPLPASAIEAKYLAPSRTLHGHKLEHLLFINDCLKEYDPVTDLFDAFVHIDAENTEYVYEWRQEQEAQLRRERGSGMTDEQVVKFVDAYYPAYELFEEAVRRGVFVRDGVNGRPGAQLTVTVGRDRGVIGSFVI